MPGMTPEQEQHLQFVINRAANEVSHEYHRGQKRRDEVTGGQPMFTLTTVALLDQAIEGAAKSLINLIAVRSKL